LKNSFRLVFNFIFRTKRRGLTAKAVVYSAAARFRVYFFADKKLRNYLGKQGGETCFETPDDGQSREIKVISQRVARVAVRAPWESKCLVQAMVAQRLLRDSGIGSTLYLGVSRDKNDNRMVAHAWVRSGPFFVCGGNGEGYAVVARFTI